MDNNVLNRIEKITNYWFLKEPLYFSVFCTHQLYINNELKNPFRTGLKKIEYSEIEINKMLDEQLEELLEIEILRILLKHPYQRQPLFAKKEILTLASNFTIKDFKYCRFPLLGTNIFSLPKFLCFEEYYSLIENLLNNSSDCKSPNKNEDESLEKNNSMSSNNSSSEKQSTDNNGNKSFGDASSDNDKQNSDNSSNSNSNNENNDSNKNDRSDSLNNFSLNNENYNKMIEQSKDSSVLWEENDDVQEEINALIEFAEKSNTWGTIPGDLQELIISNKKVKIDYRRVLSFYRTSILSSKRNLTRMRILFRSARSRWRLLPEDMKVRAPWMK